jgi:hypothetical protein
VPYPGEELEWMATTAFNRAVDYYCLQDDAACKLWATKAMEIASFCPDKGALRHQLERNLLALKWNT